MWTGWSWVGGEVSEWVRSGAAADILLSRWNSFQNRVELHHVNVLTCKVCEDLLSANQCHAGSSPRMRAPTIVHAKPHDGQQEVGQNAMEKCVLMCSMPLRPVAGRLHELCSSSKHTRGRSHNEFSTVVHAEISEKVVEEAC